MLKRLFPQQADNAFRGYKLALWVYVVVLLLLGVMSVNSIFNGHDIAVNADGLPLGDYTPAGAQAVVAFYALWGATQLTLVLFGFVALFRYRALIPLVFALLLLEQLMLRTVHHFVPVAGPRGAPASWLIVVLLSLMAVGLALSLWRRRGAA